MLTQGEFWRVRFSPSAVRTVAALSQGVPRVVNLLADRALEVGCERQARTIDTRIVREAARRLNLQPAGIPRWQMQVAAAAAVILLLAGGVGWKAIAQRSQAQDAAPRATETAAPASAGNAGDQNAGRSRQRHRDDRHAAVGAARGSRCGAAC